MWTTMTGSSTEEGDDRAKFLVHGDSREVLQLWEQEQLYFQKRIFQKSGNSFCRNCRYSIKNAAVGAKDSPNNLDSQIYQCVCTGAWRLSFEPLLRI